MDLMEAGISKDLLLIADTPKEFKKQRPFIEDRLTTEKKRVDLINASVMLELGIDDDEFSNNLESLADTRQISEWSEEARLRGLIFCALRGHVDALQTFVEFCSPEELNHSLDDGSNALLIAAQNGHEECVDLLLRHHMDPNSKFTVTVQNQFGYSALMQACKFGHTACARTLIDAGADVLYRAPNGASAIALAAQRGDAATLKVCVEAGADVNVSLSNGTCPFLLCCQFGYVECLHLLIAADVDVSPCVNVVNNGMYLAAKSQSNPVAIEIIAAANARAVANDRPSIPMRPKPGSPQQSIEHMSYLYAAISNASDNLLAMLKALVAAGADPDGKESRNMSTAIILACKRGYVDIVEYLLSLGVNVTPRLATQPFGPVVVYDGMSALMFAAQRGYMAIVRMLLAHDKSNIDDRATNGCTALMLACKEGHAEIVQVLLEEGASVSKQTMKHGTTALILAAYSQGSSRTTRVLYPALVKAHAYTFWDNLALHCASLQNNCHALGYLLENGMDVNLLPTQCASALHVARASGSADPVTVLLGFGADRSEITEADSHDVRLVPFCAPLSLKELCAFQLLRTNSNWRHDALPVDVVEYLEGYCVNAAMEPVVNSWPRGHTDETDY